MAVASSPPSAALRAAERAARESYGRLLAIIAARSRDIAAAEEALAGAFEAALTQWPREGVPSRPDAWLLTTARRRLLDAGRRARVREDAAEQVAALQEALGGEGAAPLEGLPGEGLAFPDERLKLLFVCAHPAIAPEVRTPLMLQVVLGLDAARIASALLVAPKTLGQRLWRAKLRIRDAGLAFEVPEREALPARLGAVLEAVYAAYGTGWDEEVEGGDTRRAGLAEEALWLARLLVELLPEEPEARGLRALLLFTEARRPARRGPAGAYVPLDAQDTGRWVGALMAEAEGELRAAAALKRMGPFQLEAAIQSAHMARARTGRVDRQAVALLYEGLVRLAPTLGAHVGRAAALAFVQGEAAALAALDAVRGLEDMDVEAYQPYWALRAHLLARLDRHAQAREAYVRAVGLCEDPAVRRFLLERAAALPEDPAPPRA
jgi:RNA polymerase sigma-70 factor (ECF subfamily)